LKPKECDIKDVDVEMKRKRTICDACGWYDYPPGGHRLCCLKTCCATTGFSQPWTMEHCPVGEW
jgi:hypothetical protein